jgi:hypothetical protein
MARFKGPFKFEGSLGGFRSYWDSDTGEQIISTTRGKNPKNYKNRASASNVLALNEEFKAANIWSKMIRDATMDLAYLKKGRINGDLVAIAKIIQSMSDDEKMGQRKIESSKFNYPLKGFCMNHAHPFSSVCYVDPVMSISENRSEVTLRIPTFISFRKFKWPEKIAYYRVFLNISEIPDVVYAKSKKAYLPVYPTDNLGNKTVVSDWLRVIATPIDFEISAAFDDHAIPREKTLVMVTLGFEFAYAMDFNTPYVVKDHGTVAIVGCF